MVFLWFVCFAFSVFLDGLFVVCFAFSVCGLFCFSDEFLSFLGLCVFFGFWKANPSSDSFYIPLIWETLVTLGLMFGLFWI